MNEIKITIIFLGLIAHVPMGSDMAALLINAPNHQQVLIGDSDDLIDIHGFREATLNPAVLAGPAAKGKMRVLDITGAWLEAVGERKGAPRFEDSYKESVPQLRDEVSGKELLKAIKDGEDVPQAVAARYYTSSGHYYVDSYFAEQGVFGSRPAKCRPRCVKVNIWAMDTGGEYVSLISNKRTIRVRKDATITIANIPKVCPVAGDGGHFAMFGAILEGTGYVQPPAKSTKCEKPNSGSCQYACSRLVDIECSNTRFP